MNALLRMIVRTRSPSNGRCTLPPPGPLDIALVATLILSTINREKTQVVLAPAMNDQMWNQPSNLRNVALAEQDGFKQVGSEVGWQACRHTGTGRMSEPEDICRVVCETLAPLRKPRVMRGYFIDGHPC